MDLSSQGHSAPSLPFPASSLGKAGKSLGQARENHKTLLALSASQGLEIGKESWGDEGQGPQEVGLALHRVEGLAGFLGTSLVYQLVRRRDGQ